MRREQVRRLLVRGPNWIGDAVMCEPALSATRALFPEAEITLLVKPAVAELFTGHPSFDQILTYEDPGAHSGLLGKWTLAKTLQRRHFDMAILFQNAFEAALLAFCAGVPRRYGYATDARSLFLTDPIAVPERHAIGHHVHYYLALLQPLGVDTQVGRPQLYLSEQEARSAEKMFSEVGLGETDFVIGLNPGSTYGSAKRWLPERFAETADRLVRDGGLNGRGSARVVIVGARGEEALGQAIADKMEATPLQLAGRTSVRELMAVIKRCRLFVTNDTGPMHIAAALGVPVVAVFGPTDPGMTSPLGDHTTVRHAVDCAPCLLRECPIDHRCMTRVTVEEVYEAARCQLRANKPTRAQRRSLGSQNSSSCQSSELSTCQPANLSALLKGVTVFLDRDGTVNRDTGYVKKPKELELLDGAVEAIARLNRTGARVVLITNQSGIGRGMFSRSDLEQVHLKLRDLLARGGATLDAIYYCPHHPDDRCACRKPRTGLVDQAVHELGIDLSHAYVVGDQKRDVELARTVGTRAVLVTISPTSLETLQNLQLERCPPDYAASTLVDAVEWILKDTNSEQQSAISTQHNRKLAGEG